MSGTFPVLGDYYEEILIWIRFFADFGAKIEKIETVTGKL